MKLYTEEELRRAIGKSRLADGFVNGVFQLKYTIEEVLEQSLPIELPSDEEIKDKSFNKFIQSNARTCFEEGAKWMKKKYLTKTNNL